MWTVWLVCGAAACDLALQASHSDFSGDINIWEVLEALTTPKAHFEVCLESSDNDHRFVFADLPSGCSWTPSALVIQ